MKQRVGLHMTGVENALGLKEGTVRAPAMPNVAINKPTNIDLGGIFINLIPVPASHTPSPIVVHVKKDNVVYAGDSLYSGRMLSIVPGGNANSWIKNFEFLQTSFPNATFVPGHGKPAKLNEGFRKSTYDYLVHLDKHMSRAVDEGIDLQDAIKSLDQSAWKYLDNYEQLAGRNAHQTYIEREAAAFQ